MIGIRATQRAAVRAHLGLSEGPLLPRLGEVVRRCAGRVGVGELVPSDDRVLGSRTLAAVSGITIGAIWSGSAGCVIGGIGGVAAARMLEGRTRAAREEQILRALPPVLDRISMCVLSGRSIDAAIATVASGAPGLLAPAFDAYLGALAVGRSRREAYGTLGAFGGSECARLGAALERSDRLGASIADALVAHARDVRARARALAETRVRAAPVKLVFPLVFCFLPAFVVLAVGPVAISALRTLSAL